MNEIEPKYYADGEDAYAMRRDLVEFADKVYFLHTLSHFTFEIHSHFCIAVVYNDARIDSVRITSVLLNM